MEATHYKNKVTKEIAEYDSVMGLFYIMGDKKYVPISPLKIAGDPNWEECTEPIPEVDPASSARKKFLNWINGK
jgi:hypothetical protein